MGYIFIRALLNPTLAPSFMKVAWKEKFISLGAMGPVTLLVLAVLGTIYLGIATPTEAAALGVTMACILGLVSRTLTWQAFKESLKETVQVTCGIMLIFVGASLISMILSNVGIPNKVATAVAGANIPPYVVLLLTYIIYLILGCFFDPMSVLVLTLPVLFPVIVALGFDSIWFGIILVVLIEAGMITPPVGLNLYIIQGIAPKYGFDEIVKIYCTIYAKRYMSYTARLKAIISNRMLLSFQ